jgi:hypothetical protein
VSGRVSGVPEHLRALSRTLTDVAPELDRAATRLTTAELPAMPPGVTDAVAGTLSQVGESIRRVALAVTREGLDVRRRSVWLEIAGAGGLLVSLHRPRPPGPWEPFPWPGFGSFPREGLSPLPEPGPQLPDFTPPPERWPRLPDFTPPPEPRPLPGLPPLLGIPPLPGFSPAPERPSIATSDDGSDEEEAEGETSDGEEEAGPRPTIDDPESFEGMDPEEGNPTLDVA